MVPATVGLLLQHRCCHALWRASQWEPMAAESWSLRCTCPFSPPSPATGVYRCYSTFWSPPDPNPVCLDGSMTSSPGVSFSVSAEARPGECLSSTVDTRIVAGLSAGSNMQLQDRFIIYIYCKNIKCWLMLPKKVTLRNKVNIILTECLNDRKWL